MQILGQSLIPPNPVPYLHLGYGAAVFETTRDIPARTEIVLGGLGLFIVCLLLLIPLRRWRKAVLLVGLLGIAMTATAIFLRLPRATNDPLRVTLVNMHALYIVLIEHIVKEGTIPAGIRNLPTTYRGEDGYADAWRHPLRLITRHRNGQREYTIGSDGQDGRPGTADDLTDQYWISDSDITKARLDCLNQALLASDSIAACVRTYATLSAAQRTDIWNRPFRVTKSGAHITIESAGPDGRFDTRDDLYTLIRPGYSGSSRP